MTIWKGKSVLVTGGSGFLGSYLIDELLMQGSQVVVTDISQSVYIDPDARFMEADLAHLTECLRVTRGVDSVFNLAGLPAGLGYSSKHHGELLYKNLSIAANMLEAARLNQVERFHVVSTSCVYPDDAPVPTPELPVMTGEPELANRGYGWAKRIAELQASYYAEEYGMHVTISRPFNPYGARYQWAGEKSHVIPSLVKRVMENESPLIVWGSGKQRRNFLHASDTARLMIRVAELAPIAQAVNIGYEDTISIEQLVELILNLSSRRPTVVFDSTKPEGKFCKSADSTFLRSVVGDYYPAVSLADGLAEMIQSHQSSSPDVLTSSPHLKQL